MKKIFKLLMLVFAISISAIIINVKAINSAPNTIKTGTGEKISNYIGNISFSSKVTIDGIPAYCVNRGLKSPHNMIMNLVEEADAGITYIIKNGYPNKSFTGNDKQDYYITQTALWWYLDETKGVDYLGEEFKTNGSDKYNLRDYIIELKNAGLEAKEKGYSKPSISFNSDKISFTLSNDGKYYYSSEIIINGLSTNNKITLNLKNAPKDSNIINENGEIVTEVKEGTKVKVRIPKENIKSLDIDMTITAHASGVIEKSYIYKPSNSNYQSIVVSTLYNETNELKASKDINIKTSEVIIIKKDKDTKEPLAGATFALKNSKGETIKTWISTKESYVVSGLPEGKYVIEELNAPSGYIKAKDNYTVILEAGKTITVELYNSKEIIKVDSKLNITKVNGETGQPIAGATLVLKDANGNELEVWETNTEAHIINDIKPGKYYISELKAPEGFVLSEEVLEIEVTEDGGTVIATFYNVPEVEVPNTKSSISRITILLGGFIIAIGTSVIIITLKKEVE